MSLLFRFNKQMPGRKPVLTCLQPGAIAVFAGLAIFVASALVWTPSVSAKGSSSSSNGSSYQRSKHRSYRGLVPPPPPMAVSPTVLAMYPPYAGYGLRFMPMKPKELIEELKLTAIMDDLAFFSIEGQQESIHLKEGASYQTVKVAEIKDKQVTLIEKGRSQIKYLQ